MESITYNRGGKFTGTLPHRYNQDIRRQPRVVVLWFIVNHQFAAS